MGWPFREGKRDSPESAKPPGYCACSVLTSSHPVNKISTPCTFTVFPTIPFYLKYHYFMKQLNSSDSDLVIHSQQILPRAFFRKTSRESQKCNRFHFLFFFFILFIFQSLSMTLEEDLLLHKESLELVSSPGACSLSVPASAFLRFKPQVSRPPRSFSGSWGRSGFPESSPQAFQGNMQVVQTLFPSRM